MPNRFFAYMGVPALLIAAVSLAPVPADGQARTAAAKPKTTSSTKTWTPPRTPDGQPDLQGIWSYATLTPMERPRELAGKEVFTEKEAVDYEKACSIRTIATAATAAPKPTWLVLITTSGTIRDRTSSRPGGRRW